MHVVYTVIFISLGNYHSYQHIFDNLAVFLGTNHWSNMLAGFDAEFAGEAWKWIYIHIRQHKKKKKGKNSVVKLMESKHGHGLHV